MNPNSLAEKMLGLLEKVGGWRTITESISTRVLFLLLYLVTEQVALSALAAVGWVLAIAVIRWRTERKKWWQAGIPFAVVVVSALLAGGSGHAVAFYLPEIVPSLILGPVFLMSMLIRMPIVGLVIEGVHGGSGQRLAWRSDQDIRRRYQRCTAVFLLKFVVAAAVTLPLYVAENVIGLGIAGVFTTPALVACVYVCWRILRTEEVSAVADEIMPNHGAAR